MGIQHLFTRKSDCYISPIRQVIVIYPLPRSWKHATNVEKEHGPRLVGLM